MGWFSGASPSGRDAQHLERPLVVLLAALEAVVAAVDPSGDLPEVALVGQFVEAVRLPEPAGDPEAHFRLRRLLRVLLPPRAGRVAGRAVVGTAGELDRAAALVALAVAGLGVAQVLAPLVGFARSDLFHVAQLPALVGELGQERGPPLRRV